MTTATATATAIIMSQSRDAWERSDGQDNGQLFQLFSQIKNRLRLAVDAGREEDVKAQTKEAFSKVVEFLSKTCQPQAAYGGNSKPYIKSSSAVSKDVVYFALYLKFEQLFMYELQMEKRQWRLGGDDACARQQLHLLARFMRTAANLRVVSAALKATSDQQFRQWVDVSQDPIKAIEDAFSDILKPAEDTADNTDTQTQSTQHGDVLQLLKSTLAEFESDLREVLMAFSQGKDTYMKTKEALAKYGDILDYMKVSNPADPIRSYQRAAETLAYPMEELLVGLLRWAGPRVASQGVRDMVGGPCHMGIHLYERFSVCGDYEKAVYKIKHSLYTTLKTLADFKSANDLQQISFDEEKVVRKVMAAFRDEFHVFLVAQFRVGQPIENVQEAMDNLTRVFANVDSAPPQLYEALFSLREVSQRFEDSLVTFYDKYSDLWERLHDVQNALSRCDEVPALSNATMSMGEMQNNPMQAKNVYKDFMDMVNNFGVDQPEPPSDDKDSWDADTDEWSAKFKFTLRPQDDPYSQYMRREEARKERLFQAFADFLRWMGINR
ncbi:hypothetical protein BaRGS_00024296 [Batillaria attramentaria]|uniref:Uncharacterized protein n=1 Tax=Batillaria attramentaria TaxID=370345 RepID=A0ABD0KBD2_9CAEN